ncbi:MAG: ABC transporter permease [Candidatus Hydrogenedentales bacterium]
MPIYEQTYKPWKPRGTTRSRWWTVAAQELRVARTSPLFRRLFLLSMLPFMLYVFVLIVVDLMTANPSQLLRAAIQEVHIANIDALFFRTYISLTLPFVFLFCLYIGGGSICNDYRNNLLEVYFAKPLSRFDYFIGKLAAVCCVPLFLTAALSWFLIAFHVLLSPTAGWAFLSANYWVPFACVGYACAVIVPYSLLIMACSSMTKSATGASIVACAILFVNGAMGNALAEILRRPNVRCISLTRCIIYLSDLLFGGRSRITLHWGIVVAGMAAFCLLCVWIAYRRIRAVEVG